MGRDTKYEVHEVAGTLGWSEETVRESMRDGNYSYETLYVDWDGNHFEWRTNFGWFHAEIWRVNFFGLEGCDLRDHMTEADRDIYIFRFPPTKNPVEVYEMLVAEMRELQYDRNNPEHPDYTP